MRIEETSYFFTLGETLPVFCQTDGNEKFCYAARDKKSSFTEAVSFCLKAKGRLFEPKNIKNFKSVLFGAKNITCWIGIETKNDNDWVYVSSGKTVPFENWKRDSDGTQKEPNSNDEDCVEVNGDNNGKLYWNDENCSDDNKFICQFNVTAPYEKTEEIGKFCYYYIFV